jgi:hypothetical protein
MRTLLGNGEKYKHMFQEKVHTKTLCHLDIAIK